MYGCPDKSPGTLIIPFRHDAEIGFPGMEILRLRRAGPHCGGSVALSVVASCAAVSRSVIAYVTDLVGIVLSGLSALVIEDVEDAGEDPGRCGGLPGLRRPDRARAWLLRADCGGRARRWPPCPDDSTPVVVAVTVAGSVEVIGFGDLDTRAAWPLQARSFSTYPRSLGREQALGLELLEVR